MKAGQMTQKPVQIVAFRPGNAPAPAPAELGVAGTQLWDAIVTEWDISDSGGLAVLQEACHSRDVSERLRRQIAATGDEVELSGGGTKPNGLIVLELQARSLTARLLGRLGVLDAKSSGDRPKPKW
jgi:hypothetical protein